MANAGTVEIDFAAETAKFTAELKKVRSQLQDLQSTTKQIASGFEKAGKIVTGVFSGLAIGRAIGAVVRATAEAEEASAKLANALKNSGVAADLSVDQLKDYASQLQRTTTVSDEAVQEVESLLLSFRSLSGDTVLKATSAVLDLSERMGTDLRSAALQVGKALEDPTKGLAALAKAGVILPPSLRQTVELLTKTGQQAKAQALILAELEKSFGGAAAAARNNFGGALKGVQNAFDDLLEAPSGAPGATKALNQLADALSSPEMKEGVANLVTGLTKIVELTALVAARGPNLISNAVSQLLVPGAGLNAVQLLEREKSAQEEIIKQIEHNVFVSKESVDLEKARLETLKQRIALLKAANAEPIEPVKVTSTRVAQAAPDTSTFDVAKRKQELDAALESTRAALKTTLNEFDALNAKADETQKRIIEGTTKSTLDGQQAVRDQLNAIIEQDVQRWIEAEDTKRDATRRSTEARYQLEAELAQQKKALEQGALNASLGLLSALSARSKTAAKAQIVLNRGLQIAQAVQNTAAAVTNALASVPYPANLAAAAQVQAMGALQIGIIAATGAVEIGNVSRGTSGGIGGSTLGTPSNPLPVAPQEPIGSTQKPQQTINVFGWSEAAIRDLIRLMRETGDAYDLTIVRH